MRGVAGIGGAAVAKVPQEGGGKRKVDQGAVGPEKRGRCQAGDAGGKFSGGSRVNGYRMLYAVAATVQVGDKKGYGIGACSGIGMLRLRK